MPIFAVLQWISPCAASGAQGRLGETYWQQSGEIPHVPYDLATRLLLELFESDSEDQPAMEQCVAWTVVCRTFILYFFMCSEDVSN